MKVTKLFRHPIKSHGRERLDTVRLTKGQSMPFDRRWAVAHESAKADGSTWAPCANFSRGSKAPKLMAIDARLDEASELVTLTHPDRDPITLHPMKDAARLVEWVTPLVPQDRALPARIFELPERGFTDAPFASISLCNDASHHAVEALSQTALSPIRWRGNIWFDGAPAWQEFEWIGCNLRLGNAVISIKERIVRCMATTANPETGARDVDTLHSLKILGHQNFGIYGEVIESGEIAVGDSIEVV